MAKYAFKKIWNMQIYYCAKFCLFYFFCTLITLKLAVIFYLILQLSRSRYFERYRKKKKKFCHHSYYYRTKNDIQWHDCSFFKYLSLCQLLWQFLPSPHPESSPKWSHLKQWAASPLQMWASQKYPTMPKAPQVQTCPLVPWIKKWLTRQFHQPLFMDGQNANIVS